MAEQRGFEHVVGNGCAIDRHEGLRARRLLMDIARQHFLAGPGLAGNQHGRVTARHARGQLQQLPTGRLTGDRPLFIGTAHAPGGMTLHQAQQRLGLERLDQVIDSALAHGLHGTLHRGVGSHQQHRQLRMLGTQLSQQLVPIHARHVHIADHQAEGLASHCLERLLATAHRTVGETADFQGIAQGLAQDTIVLDQQHLDRHHASPSPARRSTAAPRPHTFLGRPSSAAADYPGAPARQP